MISQANRRPGHATCFSTRPVEAFRPRNEYTNFKRAFYIYIHITIISQTIVKIQKTVFMGLSGQNFIEISDVFRYNTLARYPLRCLTGRFYF